MSGSGIWSWTDGSAWSYENWRDAIVPNRQGAERLIQYRNGLWRDVNHATYLTDYLCQYTL